MQIRLSVVGKTWAWILVVLAMGALTGIVSARQPAPADAPSARTATGHEAANSIPAPPGPLPPRMMYQR
jgi:hypothetical protein